MSEFLFLTQDNHDASFNLASEEYLLKQKGGYYIYLWRNAPSVIIGVNQNALAEVNLGFTEQNKIKVVRRLTGGGAVYHDLQNINYTVIAPYDEKVDNYKKFTKPIIEYLNKLGVQAEFSGRNDITVDGKKISGNAQTIWNGKIMHHGTLLYRTDMSKLSGALKPNKLKIESKGIKSVRARVANIYDLLPNKLSVDEFLLGLCSFFKRDCEEYTLNREDISKIQSLVREKYGTYEWNIGRSPIGKNTIEDRFSFGTLQINFDTKDGLIENVQISGDFFSRQDIKGLENQLDGVKFLHTDIKNALRDISKFIVGAEATEIANMFFRD